MKILRLFHILRTVAAYRLIRLLPNNGKFSLLKATAVFAPLGRRYDKRLSEGENLRNALEALGPIFIKFGQALSTRPDLIPVRIARALESLQDDVEPFDWREAKPIIESELQLSCDEVFRSVNPTALASASIAQVHAAELHNGDEVVIKVLRPGIRGKIRKDVELLKSLARMIKKYWKTEVQVDPEEIVAEFEKTIYDELDLQREAANASLLRRNFTDSPDVYIPAIYWDYSKRRVMVQERIHGISIKDTPAMLEAGINLQVLAEKGIRMFYTQVFRDNFFHADVHPGNLFINPDNPQNPQIILLDFGICGSLPKGHRTDLANNFMAFFKRDYKRIAALHVESGWVPPDTNLEDLEAAIRTICEPYFSRPIEEISFGEVMLKTFQTAKRFNLIIQPEFVLLQKTLLNIEGLGRQLYPQMNIWEVSEPILAEIMKQHYGSQGALERVRQNLPKWLEHGAELPELMYQYFAHRTKPLPRHLRYAREKQDRLNGKKHNKIIHALLASGLLIAGAVLYLGDARHLLWDTVPASAAISGLLAALFTWKALK